MIEIYFDGACGPKNPGGTACYGWLIKKDGKVLESGCGVIGSGEGMTNNIAEYHGAVEGIKAFVRNDYKDVVTIFGDSSMVCHMLAKEWGWKKKFWNPHPKFPQLRKLLEEAHSHLENIDHKVQWIGREKNDEADKLSKEPLIKLGLASEDLEFESCDKCQSKMIIRKGKFGTFWGCVKYPKCTNTKKVS